MELRPARASIPTSGEPPFISILIPCRNEASYIRPCLASILESDYPQDRLEVLVIDGWSDDGTREIIVEMARSQPSIRLLDNPRRITPVALNLGIRESHGTIIVRMDAHVTYPPAYLPLLVRGLLETGADNVGGVIVTLPANESATARAIAIGLSHPMGVGNAYFRIGVTKRRDVKTVPFGCFRREVFDAIGLFDEELARNQDDEFNFRLVRHGRRVVLLPEVIAYYYARPSLRLVARMFYQYGWFKPLVARKVGGIVTLRQLAPAALVASLAGCAVLSPFASAADISCGFIAGGYAAAVLACAAAQLPRHGVRCAAMLAAVFTVLHFSYGFGYLRGLVHEVTRRPAAALGGPPLPLSR